jgi:hypothetical protein
MKQYDDYLRWLYRGGHPNRFARLQNRASAIAFAAGIAPGRAAALEITGRRSGRVISFPVALADIDGERSAGRRAICHHGSITLCDQSFDGASVATSRLVRLDKASQLRRLLLFGIEFAVPEPVWWR